MTAEPGGLLPREHPQTNLQWSVHPLACYMACVVFQVKATELASVQRLEAAELRKQEEQPQTHLQ